MPRSTHVLAALSLLPVLSALPAGAYGVTLAPPGQPLKAGEVHLLKPVAQGCSLSAFASFDYKVTDLTGRNTPFHLVQKEDGSAEFRAPRLRQGGRFGVSVRATDRFKKSPRVQPPIVLEVLPCDGPRRLPAELEGKDQPDSRTPCLWDLPFRLELAGRKLNGMTLDTSVFPPVLVALTSAISPSSPEKEVQLLRLPFDGKCELIAQGNQLLPPATDQAERRSGPVRLVGPGLLRGRGAVFSHADSGRILLADSAGKVSSFANFGAESGRPLDLTVTGKGEVLVRSLQTIQKVSAESTPELLCDLEAEYRRLGLGDHPILDFAPSGGGILIAEGFKHRIFVLSPSGQLQALMDDPWNLGAQACNRDPIGLLGADPAGKPVFISARGLWRLGAGNQPEPIAGMEPDSEWDGGPVVAGREAKFGPFWKGAPAPGGGWVVFDGAGRLRFIGPGPGDLRLMRRVEDAVEAYRDGRTAAGDRIVANLELWATWPKDAEILAKLHQGPWSANRGTGLGEGLPRRLQGHAAGFLYDREADYG